MIILKNMNDLNKRLWISIFIVLLVALLIFFSKVKIVSFLLLFAVASLSSIGIWEYVNLARAKDLKPNLPFMIVFSFSMVLAFFVSQTTYHAPVLPFIILLFGMICSFITHFKDPRNTLIHVAVEVFGVLYIAVPLSLFFGIIYPSQEPFAIVQDGRWWFLYLIVVTKITDIGAFFVGRIWGAHPLATFISPKKTWEGALAGFACAVVSSIALYFLGRAFAGGAFTIELYQAIILGAILGVLGQVGDLAESLLKRDAVVKDSNRLPGLGGVLDMMDSLLFTTPTLYCFLSL